jgi:hypothetical protein
MRFLACLLRQKLPNFKSVALSEVKELHEVIDTNRSGDVTVDEFRAFVKEGKLYAPADRVRSKEERGKRDADARGGDRGGCVVFVCRCISVRVVVYLVDDFAY